MRTLYCRACKTFTEVERVADGVFLCLVCDSTVRPSDGLVWFTERTWRSDDAVLDFDHADGEYDEPGSEYVSARVERAVLADARFDDNWDW